MNAWLNVICGSSLLHLVRSSCQETLNACLAEIVAEKEHGRCSVSKVQLHAPCKKVGVGRNGPDSSVSCPGGPELRYKPIYEAAEDSE